MTNRISLDRQRTFRLTGTLLGVAVALGACTHTDGVPTTAAIPDDYHMRHPIAVEEAMLFGGALLYARATRPRDRIGGVALWVLVGVLAVMHVGAIVGPPPPSAQAMNAVAFALFSLLGVAWWIDRHRDTVIG